MNHCDTIWLYGHLLPKQIGNAFAFKHCTERDRVRDRTDKNVCATTTIWRAELPQLSDGL